MRDYYPAIEPYESGMLPVGDGNQVYWETSGNPEGKPVVFLHGGPGGGSSPDHRRQFDPEAYRIVLLDQRGCGRSTPHLSDPEVDLAANTTWHLVADLELLREHLGIDRWQVFGGSWGSTLALAYAQTHPERVTELVLRGVFTIREQELDWVYGGRVAALFPEAWEELLAAIPDGRHTGDLIRTFSALVDDDDPAVRDTAAVAWTRWEARTVALLERPELVNAFADGAFAAAFARLELHYFANRAWLEEGQLIRDAGKLAGIPGVLVQGRYDALCPPVTAWDLHRAWPGSELVIAPGAGHAFDEPEILHHLIETTDRFRDA